MHQPKRKFLCTRQDAENLELILCHPTQPLLTSPLPFLYPGHQKCWRPLDPLPWGAYKEYRKQRSLKRGCCTTPKLKMTGGWEWVAKDPAGRAWLHIRTQTPPPTIETKLCARAPPPCDNIPKSECQGVSLPVAGTLRKAAETQTGVQGPPREG